LAQVACAICHAPTHDLPLAGGAENFLAIDSTHAMGILWAPNLTPAGVLRKASDGEIARAIREGIGTDGHTLLIMPSARFHALSDADVAAIIGYMRTEPAVARPLPPRKLGLMPNIILGLHQFPTSVQPPLAGPVPAATETETPGYGKYMVSLLTCQDCHGEALRGIKRDGPGPPAAPDIVAAAHGASFETFDRALRGGIGRSGKPLNPSSMPWPNFARLTDLEAKAIYAYLKSLGAS
jgi:mono/diheme cytochrome c family protein